MEVNHWYEETHEVAPGEGTFTYTYFLTPEQEVVYVDDPARYPLAEFTQNHPTYPTRELSRDEIHATLAAFVQGLHVQLTEDAPAYDEATLTEVAERIREAYGLLS